MGGFDDETYGAYAYEEEAADYLPAEDAGDAKEEQDALNRKDILQRLETVIKTIYDDEFFLSPFGSSVTKFSSEKSDFDLSLILVGKGADEKGNNVRAQVVLPTLQNISRVLKNGNFKLKEFIRTARVPIVALECNKHGIPADISVNQPFGLLNSWLLRDYASPSVIELVLKVKAFAKSKGLCNARDGYFSAYGWTLLTLCFLMENDFIQSVYHGNAMDETNLNPFFDTDEGLEAVVDAVRRDPEDPRPYVWCKSDHMMFDIDDYLIKDLFQYILDHLKQDQKAVKDRNLASIRNPGQNNWDELMQFTKKPDHWQKPVYAVIEEPFSGENVGRVLRVNGHRDTIKELERAIPLIEEGTSFDEILELKQLAPPPPVAGQKRPLGPRQFPLPAAQRPRIEPNGMVAAPRFTTQRQMPGHQFQPLPTQGGIQAGGSRFVPLAGGNLQRGLPLRGQAMPGGRIAPAPYQRAMPMPHTMQPIRNPLHAQQAPRAYGGLRTQHQQPGAPGPYGRR